MSKNLIKYLLISRKYHFKGSLEDLKRCLKKSHEYEFACYLYNNELEFIADFGDEPIHNRISQKDGIKVFGKISNDLEDHNDQFTIELYTKISSGVMLGIIAGVVVVAIGLAKTPISWWIVGLGILIGYFIVGIYRVYQSVLMEAIQNCCKMRRVE